MSGTLSEMGTTWDPMELLEPAHKTAVFMWGLPSSGKGRHTQMHKYMKC